MLSTQTHDQSSLGLSMSAHQIFSGAPSSLSANSSATIDKQKKQPCKRKRTNDAASDSAESTSQAGRTRDGPKKKKANRACFHCQKAHLTCDDCESSLSPPRVARVVSTTLWPLARGPVVRWLWRGRCGDVRIAVAPVKPQVSDRPRWRIQRWKSMHAYLDRVHASCMV